MLLSSCAHEYNQVLKSGDYTYKYEYAKQSYAQGKYSRAIPLLQELVNSILFAAAAGCLIFRFIMPL